MIGVVRLFRVDAGDNVEPKVCLLYIKEDERAREGRSELSDRAAAASFICMSSVPLVYRKAVRTWQRKDKKGQQPNTSEQRGKEHTMCQQKSNHLSSRERSKQRVRARCGNHLRHRMFRHRTSRIQKGHLGGGEGTLKLLSSPREVQEVAANCET